MIDAVSILKNGGVIVYPTDTAYAIGCDATNESAVKKIFEIKGRDRAKTLSLIVADRVMAENWVLFSERARELADEYWPGPLGLVLPLKNQTLVSAASEEGYVALRVPDSAIATDLSRKACVPIVATSANASGDGPCYSIQAVRTSLGPASAQVDCFVDGGELLNRGVSTIVKVWDNEVIIIRPGAVTLDPSTRPPNRRARSG